MSKSSRYIDGLKTNTLYTILVRAHNAKGWSADLSDAVEHTTLYDSSAPSSPGSPGITVITTINRYLLQWAIVSDASHYNLYVYTSNTPASAKIIKRIHGTRCLVDEGEVTEDTSITIAASTTYYFWVTSVDASGNESSKVALGSGSL